MRLAGLWFGLTLVALAALVMSCRQPQPAPQISALIAPVASVDQIMTALIAPASDIVFKSGALVTSWNGLEKTSPTTDKEWKSIENNAAILVESGNLLLIGNRVKDQKDWVTFTKAYMVASKLAMDAARDRNSDALEASLDGIYLTCERCHVKYLK